MRKRIKKIAVNSLLVFLSLAMMVGVLEFVVFRFIVSTTDIPQVEFSEGLVRYAPHQSGVFRIANESAAAFRINAQGWHSQHPAYTKEKGGKKRVAVIGDSYVAGLEVGTEQMLTRQLEQLLGEADYEVYNFGIGGAPLSHYLHVLRHEVLPYEPDVVIFVVVKNDFRDSYVFHEGSGRYGSSFLKLIVQDGTVVREVEPEAYHGQWRWLVGSSLFRYFWYQYKAKGVLGYYKQELVKESRDREAYEALDYAPVEAPANHKAVITYFMEQVAAHRQPGREILVVLNADVGGIQKQLSESRMVEYSTLFGTLACQNDLLFLDLHPAFSEDYRRHAQRFNFERDLHWNAYAHGVASKAIAGILQDDSACAFESPEPADQNALLNTQVPQ